MTVPVHALIDLCRRRGIVLAVQGDRLRYRPVDAVDGELRGQLAANKADLLAALTAPPPDPDPGVMLRLDALDRRVLDAIDRGETFTLRLVDLAELREWNWAARIRHS